MQDEKGTIFKIQRFSIHDGPGIRSTVFLKGCNLRCRWCHNPESYSQMPQIQYQPGKCVECGCCGEVCPEGMRVSGRKRMNEEKCRVCGLCESACCFDAVKVIGQELSAEEVMDTIRKDLPYYQKSGGGLTVSGGEPLLQPLFVRKLFQLAKEAGIHTALDTAGCVAYDAFEQVLPFTDLILLDLKIMDEQLHKTWTGVSNRLILQNAEKLMQTGKDINIRVPVIEGVNNTKENMEQLKAFISDAVLVNKVIKKVELLPYHALGVEKGESFGISLPVFQAPNEQNMKELKEVLHYD